MAENQSIVVAITGGIGSGKSSVADIIRNMGYKVLSSDDKAKELTQKNKPVISEIKKHFGNEAYSPEGKLNSSYIAAKVFGDSPENDRNLATLNRIVHPAVIDNMIKDVEKLEASGEKLIFVESALTFEANLAEGFDYILVVDAPEELCIQRVMKRSGLTEKQVRQRMRTQMHPAEKKKAADFIIDNSKSPDHLKSSVEFIVNILKNL